MKRYKRILVPLELTEEDSGSIAWAAKVAGYAGAEEVEFIHAVEVSELPEAAREKYPWLMDPLDEVLRKRMEDLVELKWMGKERPRFVYTVVKETSAVLAILEAVLKQESDLVVVNRDLFSAELAVRLARKAPCSVMSVPGRTRVKLDRILVPTDFSENCLGALDIGLAFAEAGKLGSIDSLHVCDLGRFSHRVTLPQEEIEAIMEEFAEEEHQKHVTGVDTRGIRIELFQRTDNFIPSGIAKHVMERQVDLVIAGCRGRHAMTSLLLGGTVEELLKHATVPVIAAKHKGTGRKLLEELLGA